MVAVKGNVVDGRIPGSLVLRRLADVGIAAQLNIYNQSALTRHR